MKLSSTSNTVTPKGTTKEFIPPEYFLNFFSNLYIPRSGVKIIGRYIFAHALKQYSPQGRRKLPISSKQGFLKIYFLPSRMGGGLWS